MTAAQEAADRATPPAQAPPRPGAGRFAAAGVAVAALLLAALLLRTDGSSWTAARGPLSGNFSVKMLIALGWLAAVGALAGRYRSSVRGVQGLSPRAERLKEATLVLLPALAVGVPALMVIFTNPGNVAPDQGGNLQHLQQRQRVNARSHTPTGDAGPGHLLPVLTGVVEAVIVLLVVVGLAIGLVSLWRRRHALWGDPAQPPALAQGAADEEVLAEAVDSARRALHGDDARAAVIACYAAMEDSLAGSGAARQASDSPTDLLDRVVSNGTLRAAEAVELTTLFREARYSSHPMGPAELRRAGAALEAVAAQLAERAAESERAAQSEQAERSAATERRSR